MTVTSYTNPALFLLEIILMLRFRIVGFLALLSLSPAISCAELKLPAMFSDSMVLQRDQQIKIWGWATSGSDVSV